MVPRWATDKKLLENVSIRRVIGQVPSLLRVGHNVKQLIPAMQTRTTQAARAGGNGINTVFATAQQAQANRQERATHGPPP